MTFGVYFGFGVGIIFSALVGWLWFANSRVGTLRLGKAEPCEPPYIFLELDVGGMEKIHHHKIAVVKIDLDGYTIHGMSGKPDAKITSTIMEKSK